MLKSFLIGTIGLTALLLFSVLYVFQRRGAKSWELTEIRPWILMMIAVQVLHVTEEAWQGFHIKFPAFLELPPWAIEWFLVFNAVWIAIWLTSCLQPRAGRFKATVFFFLAIASVANAFAHVLLSVNTGDYFPGLVTAPICGVFGWVLFRKLKAQTGS